MLGKSINAKYKYCSVDFLLFSDQIHNKKAVGILEVGSKDKYYGHSSILLTDNNFGYIRLLTGSYMIKVRVYSNNNDVLKKKGVVFSCYSEGKVLEEKYLYYYFLGRDCEIGKKWETKNIRWILF